MLLKVSLKLIRLNIFNFIKNNKEMHFVSLLQKVKFRLSFMHYQEHSVPTNDMRTFEMANYA